MVTGLKVRLKYIVLTVVLLAVEIIIGVFVHDSFVRPYVGDVLVTVLLCAMGRIVLPKWSWLPFSVMMFSFAVEILQMFRIDEILELQGTVLGIIVGSTFDSADLVCYSVGVAIFSLTEFILLKTKNKTE